MTYTVKQGDTLSLIAGKLFGDITLWPLIAEANNITKIDVIYPGQVLKLPNILPTVDITAKKINVWPWVIVSALIAGGAFAYKKYGHKLPAVKKKFTGKKKK